MPVTPLHKDGASLTILFLVGVWILTTLGTGLIPLERHETLVLQTAREMLSSGDWILPQFNGEPRLQKPPLSYWATIVISLLDPFSSDIEIRHGRFVSLASGLMIVLLTYSIGSILYGRETGFLCGLLLMTTAGYIHQVPSARPDVLYAALCSLQLFAWIAAWRAEDRSRRQVCCGLLGWVGAALATLTKGPQAPAVFLLGFLIFLLFGAERKRTLMILRPVTGALLYFALVLPWWILLENRLDALEIPLADTQLSGSLLHQFADWKGLLSGYYLYTLVLLMLPAALAVPFFFREFRKSRNPLDDISRLLFSVGITFLIVFAIGGHYRKHYLLPLLPIASLSLGNAFYRHRSYLQSMWLHPRMHLRIALLVLTSGCAGVVIYRGAFISLTILATAPVLLFILLRIRQDRINPQHHSGSIPLVLALTALSLAACNNFLPLDEERAARQSFAEHIEQTLENDDLLVGWKAHSDILPFVTNRVVPNFGTPEQIEAFIKKEAGGRAVFAVLPKDQLTELRDLFEVSLRGMETNDDEPGEGILLVQISQPAGPE